jgi:hypothetical protein
MCKWVKFLIWIGILAAAIHAGARYGMPYYRYSMFKSDVIDMVNFELNDPEELKAKILKKAEALRVPLNEKDLNVEGTSEKFRARAIWTEDVVLFGGYYKKTLSFSVEAEG